MAGRENMKQVLCSLIFMSILLALTPHLAPASDGVAPSNAVRFGSVVPLSRYVRLLSGDEVIDPGAPVALSRDEIAQLQIWFVRDSLSVADGAQFLKVTTSSTDRDEHLLDNNSQFAITFCRLGDAAADRRELERIGKEIAPFSYMNPQLIQQVPIQVDSLDSWGSIRVRVEPEQEIVKYYGRVKNRLDYHIRVKGNRVTLGYSLSVPKVLYDTRRSDPVTYGKTSAMVRLHYLNAATGTRFPVNFGFGTIGVDSPIDVSKTGGGFAGSLLFDVVDLLRTAGLRMPTRANAGLDLAPFFPLEHKPRLLIGVRLGISP
jgi:hypothetical protein